MADPTNDDPTNDDPTNDATTDGSVHARLRLRRSMLYTPGTRADRIVKAASAAQADLVVADLEDAVAPEDKASARQSVHDALVEAGKTRAADGNGRPELCVRINAWRGPWAAVDLEAVLPAAPDVVVVPKAGPLADLAALDVTLARLERRHGRTLGSTEVIAIVESTEGVFAAPRLARAARVTALAFGAEDLAADAGLRRTRSSHEVQWARARVQQAAAQAGIDAIDQVFVDIEDLDALTTECQAARDLGYAGKMVIHPRQLAPVHAAFGPSADEIAHAERLVAAVDQEGVGTGGVLRFEGRMIDVPLVAQARRVLAQARAAGLR